MSQNDLEDSAASKKAKGRACDACRVKKIRCNAADMPNGICSTCAEQGKECSYQEGTKRRTAPKWYVEKMEERMEKMELLFKKLHPDIDLEAGFGPSMPRGSWEYAQPEQFLDPNPGPATLLPGQKPAFTCALSQVMRLSEDKNQNNDPNTEDVSMEDQQKKDDEESMKVIQKMLLKIKLGDGRHYGPSSNLAFVQIALDSKPGYEAAQWSEWVRTLNPKRRKAYWTPRPWEQRSLGVRPTMKYTFPPQDLIPKLIKAYFRHGNLFYPILHGPTFLAHYANDLQERDSEFAALLMFVCAVGARWSDDPRVWEGSEVHSAGWKYFEQAWPSLLPTHEPVSLTKLQCYCVAVLFIMGSGPPQIIWILNNVALSLVQDVGAHLKGTFKHRSLIDQELYRRVFWTLYSYDSSFSSALGRLSSFSGQDFDVERPMEVDDEYWLNDDADLAWKQPPGKPSLISFFNRHLDLIVIKNETRRALFPLTRGMPKLPNGPESEQDVLVAMDSALNRWLELLPDHLRWNPQSETNQLFIQSASLHLYYHQCSIIVHREFIPTPHHPVKTTSPSLAICTNAARSTSRVLGVLRKKEVESGLSWVGASAFHAAVILLLNIWGTGGSGPGMGYASNLQDVHNCIWTLSNLERRWPVAGKLRDVLEELASVGDFPLPDETSSPPSLKRTRSGQLGRPADYVDAPAGKTLRTSNATSPLSFTQSSPSSASTIASSPSIVDLSQIGLSPDARSQLSGGGGGIMIPQTPEQQMGGDVATSAHLPFAAASSGFQMGGGGGPHPLLMGAGGLDWAAPSQQVPSSFDSSHNVFGMLGPANTGLQPAALDASNGLVAPDVLEPMTLDTLMQLWSNTPMGTGWELWDNLPMMPGPAKDLSGLDGFDAGSATSAGGAGGLFGSGFTMNE